jgi:rod shape-determining protein MreC
MLPFLLKNKRIFFLVSLLFIALTLFARDIQGKKQYSIVDKLLIALFTPPLKITTQGFQYMNRLWSKYVYLVDLHTEHAVLKERIKKIEIDNQLLQEQANENKRLRELLSFKKKFEYKMLPAEIIGRDPSSWFKTILIDKGKDDGVVKEADVITPDGVVGKEIDVETTSSKVLLVTDINS